MPWGVEDVERHIHGLTDKQKREWIGIANPLRESCIEKGGDPKECDARAIIQANSRVNKVLGEGVGVGGPPQFIGGTDTCVCPKCSYESTHRTPCTEKKCPECGATLRGKEKDVKENEDEILEVKETEESTEKPETEVEEKPEEVAEEVVVESVEEESEEEAEPEVEEEPEEEPAEEESEEESEEPEKKSVEKADAYVGFGGSVKALGDGKIGGYLVLFTDADHPDLVGDYFTKDTDFDFEDGDKTAIYYQHGFDKTLGKRRLGHGTLKMMDAGVWLDGQIELRDEYEKMVYQMIEQNKQGLSSGTASHLVEWEIPYELDDGAVGKGTWIKSWPLGLDASITPTPAEPRTKVQALKSFGEGVVETLAEAEEEKPETVIRVEVVQTELKESVDALTKELKEGEKEMDYEAIVKAAVEASMVSTRAMLEEMLPEQKAMLNTMSESKVADKYTFGDFLKAVAALDRAGLKAMGVKLLGDQTGAAGGFTVPPQFLEELIQLRMETSIVRPLATVLPMQSRTITVPGVDYRGTAVGEAHVLGGVVMRWNETGTHKPYTEPEFVQIELVARELAGYTQVKDALLQDSVVSLETLLRMQFAKAMAFEEDWSFFNGTGAGQPLGILNAGALLVIARQVAGQISYLDITNLRQQLFPPSWMTSVWICQIGTYSQLTHMVDQAGNNIWQANARVREPDTILGLPVYWTEKTPVLGATGDILLADLAYYLIGDRQAISIGASEHFAFTSNITTFRVSARLDGQPSLTQPIVTADGVTQVSPFVALGAAATT